MTSLHLPAGPLRILALGAHPDDIEIGCGGALLTLARRPGTIISGFVLTGTPERQDEASRAAALVGASPPVFGQLPDARTPDHWGEAKDALVAFRDASPAPDVVFAPRPGDAHQDHRLLGEMTTTVWRGPLVLHYEIPKWDGDLGRPTAYVPLTDEIAGRKVEILNAAFPSQHSRDWWDDEFFLALLRLRGAEARTRYAEAFVAPKVTISAGRT